MMKLKKTWLSLANYESKFFVISWTCKRLIKINLTKEEGIVQLVEPTFWICKVEPLPIVTMYVDLVERLVISRVKWCKVPLLEYHKGSYNVKSVPRIEGSSSSRTKKTRCYKLTLIDDEKGWSYMCQQLVVMWPFLPQI